MKILVLPILLTIFACDRIADGYRILGVFPINSKSHWIMMEEVMKGLARRGHQVDVITHFPLKKPIPNYTEISLAGTLPAIMNNISATQLQQWKISPTYLISYYGGTIFCKLLNNPKLRNLIENPPQDPPYDIIIMEVFGAPCFLAFGRHLGVPIVAIVSSSLHSWLENASGNPSELAFVPNTFSMHNQHMNFKQRLMNVLTYHWFCMQMHYYTNFQLHSVKENFGLDLAHITELYGDISLYLVNSHHSLNVIRPMTTNVIEVGGLHIRDDEPLIPEVQKWLDESEHGCVYFTFGSMVKFESFPEKLIRQFYMSFEKIAPVRVLMKIANKNELLEGLPKNVITYSWFPQMSVLKHKNVRAFITHGGAMGLQEAIACGVPMIGIPLFADQHSNIKHAVDKKVAISLNSIEDVTEEKLTSALNNILKDPIYRENTQRLSKLFLDRPISPLNASIYWVEYIAKYGNMLQSPALQLNWWQRNLLDIYAFIFVVIVAVLYIVLFILRKLRKLLFGSHACAKKSAAFNLKKNK